MKNAIYVLYGGVLLIIENVGNRSFPQSPSKHPLDRVVSGGRNLCRRTETTSFLIQSKDDQRE